MSIYDESRKSQIETLRRIYNANLSLANFIKYESQKSAQFATCSLGFSIILEGKKLTCLQAKTTISKPSRAKMSISKIYYYIINKPKRVNAPEGFNQVFSLKHLFNGKNEFF